jgi:hypothetical protein
MPLMLTGGLRSRAGMQAALDEGVDVLGVARPVCIDQACVKALLAGEIDRLDCWEERLRRDKGFFSSNSPIPLIGVLSNFAGIYWFYAQLYRLGRGKAPNTKLWPPRAMLEVMRTEGRVLAKIRRWRAANPKVAPLPEREIKPLAPRRAA